MLSPLFKDLLKKCICISLLFVIIKKTKSIFSLFLIVNFIQKPHLKKIIYTYLQTGKRTLAQGILKMDKLIAAEKEMYFDSPATTAQKVDFEVNPDKYHEFLNINPIWSFLGMSKEEYFKLSVQDKTTYIPKYYKHMLDGKSIFLLCFCYFMCYDLS